MVSKEQKKRMLSFVTDRIEDTNRYLIKNRDESKILLQLKPELSKDPKNPPSMYIVLHNRKMTLNDFSEINQYARKNGIYMANIFYKDGELFHVRLGQRASFKGDYKALKNYTQEELNKMIHLRGLEKEVIGKINDENRYAKMPHEKKLDSIELSYFQPETDKLEESIRTYAILPVELDYSHIEPGDPGYGFVHNRESIDYKIADEKFRVNKNDIIRFNRISESLMTMAPYKG